MKLKEIRPNMRMFAEIEHENPAYRSLRGVVIKVEDSSFHLLTDFGEVIEVSEGELLSYSNINFPRIVSDVLQELRNNHEETYELKAKLKENEKNIQEVKEQLVDAVFLSKFNIHGAKNRLMHSIPEKERLFTTNKGVRFQITFEANENGEIEMFIVASKQIDYPQFDEGRHMDRIIRTDAPELKKQIDKSFPTLKTVKVIDENVLHEDGSLYNVRRIYRLTFDINQKNFIEFRNSLFQGIELLSR